MPIATNPETGEVVYLDGDQWKPAQTAVNPQTREMRAFDGKDWVPVTVHGPGTANHVGAQSVADDMSKSRAPMSSVSELGKAVTDIPTEIGKQFSGGVKNVKEGLAATGPIGQPLGALQAIGGAVQAAGSPVVGALRSLGGHAMAAAEHAVGMIINPSVAEKDIPEEMYNKAAGQVESALSASMPKGFTTLKAAFPKVPIPEKAKLYESADAGYGEARKLGVKIKSPTDLIENIHNQLREKGIVPEDAPKTFRHLARLNPESGEVDAATLQSVLRGLGRASKDPLNGEERLAAGSSIPELQKYLENIAPEQATSSADKVPQFIAILKDANGDFAAARRMDTLEQRAENADNASTQFSQALKVQLRPVLKNPKKYGLNNDEAKQLKTVVGGTLTEKGLQFLRHISPILNYTIPGYDMALKALSGASTSRQFRILGEMVAARSPLAKKMKAAPSNFTRPPAPTALAPGLGAPGLMDSSSGVSP